MKIRLANLTVPLLLVALIAFFAVAAPGFASLSNALNLLRQVAVLGIVSAGMAPVIIAGQIDLSVGSVLSLVSCCIAAMIAKAGVPPVFACLAGIGMAAVILIANGIVIEITRMPSLLCTLATMQVYQGIAYLITDGMPVYGLPESMRMIGQGYLSFVPVPVIVCVIVFLAIAFLLRRTVLGRYIYATGSNAEATYLSGVSVAKTTLATFAMCGILVGLAACVQTSRLFGGFPTAGTGLEMEVVTAVVVGGVSFAGGSGKMSGVFLGVLLMGVLSNGLGIMGVNTYGQMIFTGVVLVAVVGLDCWQKSRKRSSASGGVPVRKQTPSAADEPAQ